MIYNSTNRAKEACAVLYHTVLEGPRNTQNKKCNNSPRYNVELLCKLLFYLLEDFAGSQVQGSITLLMVNMYELANQFGDKNREFLDDI